MKKPLVCNLIFLGICALVAGCASNPAPPSGPRVGYGSPTDSYAGTADALTVSDFNRCATDLVDKMLSDPAFKRKLAALALPEEQLPILVMRSLENNTTKRIQQNLDSMTRDIRIKLRRSGLFDFKDDIATQTIVDRIMKNTDGGLEAGNLIGQLQTHASPNYILTGELVSFEDSGRRHTFKLYLALHDLGTNPGSGGLIVWEDSSEVIKYRNR